MLGQPYLNLENFPQKSQLFQFFSLRIKRNLIGLGQKIPGSKPGHPFLAAGQKYAQVGSGPISSMMVYPGFGLCSEQSFISIKSMLQKVKSVLNVSQ